MEGHATGTEARPKGDAAGWRDLGLVALLLLAATGLRAWHLSHTEVAARDSIGFIRYAWQLRHHSWVETIRDPAQQQHPGYPLVILAVSYPVGQLVSGPDAQVMQLSAQLASCLASVLLVLPTYWLGRELFSRGVGFGAALLFQCLPASGRVFADGLSEGVFFLAAATALFGAVRALRTHSVPWFALTGLAGGLAYLTRPEGALIVAATGLVLLAVQCLPARRAPWRRFLACGAGLSVAALIVGGPLVSITGKLTAKPTSGRLLDGETSSLPAPPAHQALLGADLMVPLAVWDTTPDRRAVWGFQAVAKEFAKGGHYVLWLPMLLGLWWFRDRFRLLPGAWVLLLVSLAIHGLMWRVATLLGYVSDRHLLLPLLCGTYWAVAALPKLVTVCAGVLSRVPWTAPLKERLPAAVSPVWATLLGGAILAIALPKTLEPLHANRSGFRDAGTWLAEHSHPWDPILDPYSWTHYYAGKVFLEDQSPAPPPGQTQVCYVVIEKSGREHPRLLVDIRNAMETAARGHVVYEWTGRRGREVVDVQVYEAPQR